MDKAELAAHAKEIDQHFHQQHQHNSPSSPHLEKSQDGEANKHRTDANRDKDVEKGAAVHKADTNDQSRPRNSTSAQSQQPTGDASAPSEQADDEAIKDRGWAAWKFILASAATEFMIWGASYGYGSFQDYHQHDHRSPFHQSSLTATSSVGTTLLAGQHFIPLLTFGLYSMFPCLISRFTYVCVVASSLSLLIASFANSVALLILFQGLLLGIFGGNLFTTVILWLPDWWDRRRGFAIALIFAGSAIGGILWPIIFTQLLERIGFRWTLRTCALIQLIVSGSAVMCLAPRRKAVRISKAMRWKAVIPAFPRSLLSTLTLLNVVALVTQTTAWYSVSLNISNYASSMGFSSSTSTGMLSAFNASAAVTYFVLGYLVDRFPYPLIMATSTLLSLVFTVLVFGFARGSLAKIILYVVFFGMSGGGFASFLTPVSRDIPDKTKSAEFSLRFLYLVAARGLAAMLGPIIAVQFYPDHLGPKSAYGSFGFTGFIAFISGTLALSTLASLTIFAYKRHVEAKRVQERCKHSSPSPSPECARRVELVEERAA
ncbi:hypothetical protein NDA11_004889 [Ustilago hordei]|nr:hypothetical protein NDA11_004889 [Ustilago hordei]KAJ1599363.1 hypothetical protein NDA14_007645 [Ustilago hordei]